MSEYQEERRRNPDLAESVQRIERALLGDPEFKSEGFIDESRRRFTVLETGQAAQKQALLESNERITATDKKVDMRHEENVRITAAAVVQMSKIARRTGVIKSCVEYLTAKGEDGKPRWTTLHTLITSFVAAGAWIAGHWGGVKTWFMHVKL